LQYMEYLQSKIPKVDFPPAKSEVGKVFWHSSTDLDDEKLRTDFLKI
jgi:hypothetical protein